MNPTLARIYGTGMSKTASAEDLDLTQISAADYLSALEGEESESDDLDLSQLSAQELIELAGELEGEDQIEKMAQSGDLAYWDAAGRTMAHAYADEMSKVASEDEIDLNEISAADLLDALDSGEYDLEKVAVNIAALKAKGMTGKQIRAAMRAASEEVPKRDMGAVRGYFGGSKKAMREGLREFKKSQPNIAEARKSERAARRAEPGRMATLRQQYIGSGSTLRDALKARPGLVGGATLGTGLVAGAGLGGGGMYVMRRRNQN